MQVRRRKKNSTSHSSPGPGFKRRVGRAQRCRTGPVGAAADAAAAADRSQLLQRLRRPGSGPVLQRLRRPCVVHPARLHLLNQPLARDSFFEVIEYTKSHLSLPPPGRRQLHAHVPERDLRVVVVLLRPASSFLFFIRYIFDLRS